MILIVDDHIDTCDVLRLLLERAGHQVESAHSGYGALALLRGRVPELIILDERMHGMTGTDVLRALRADPRLAGVPVLMYSAETDPARLAEMIRLGVRGVVTKPGWDTLLAEVGNIAGTPPPPLPA